MTSLNVRVAGAARLPTIRRSRIARLWVNGRAATRALDQSLVTHFTAKLSATQGLRYVNRLRLMVAEPEAGRYVVVRRRFVLTRNRHLAAAGWDVQTRAGGFVQLNGRRPRTAGGGQARHRWRLVRKPRGSRVTLRRAGTARPSISPDRPGRYVLRLTLSERSRRAAASQNAQPGGDSVEVTVAPARPLLPFKGITKQNGQNGILVGGTFYPNTSPNGTAIQWLTLQRGTLTLANPSDNNWLVDRSTAVRVPAAALARGRYADDSELVAISEDASADLTHAKPLHRVVEGIHLVGLHGRRAAAVREREDHELVRALVRQRSI